MLYLDSRLWKERSLSLVLQEIVNMFKIEPGDVLAVERCGDGVETCWTVASVHFIIWLGTETVLLDSNIRWSQGHLVLWVLREGWR